MLKEFQDPILKKKTITSCKIFESTPERYSQKTEKKE